MAFVAFNLSTIDVTGRVSSPSNTAHIDIERFGARSCPDSSSEPPISDAHQVEGPFLTCSPDAPLQLNHFSYDNSFNNTASQTPPQRSFFTHSSPETTSNFGADEFPSSTYDHVVSPFLSPFNHFSNLRLTSPGSSQELPNDGFSQMTLRDTASFISRSPDGIGTFLHPRRYSDGLRGGSPTSHHGSMQPQSNRFHSPLIAQIPNVGLNNGLGLIFDNGHPGGTPAQEMFFVEQGQTSLHPHAPLSPIILFSPDPHTRPSHPLPPLGMDAGNELSGGPSFTLADHTEDWPHFPSLLSFGPSIRGMDASDESPGGHYFATESYTDDGVHFPSLPVCGFPTLVDVDRGLSGEPHFAPESYSGDGAHFFSYSSCGLPPQGVDVGHGRYSAPESYTDGPRFYSRPSSDLPPQVVDIGHGRSDGPCSAPASFTEGATRLSWCSSCSLPHPGVDAGNEPYSALTYVEDEAHSPSNFLSSPTSARSPFRSSFEDETRDPLYDTVAPASSSAVSCWSGDITELSSLPKKTVSSAKHRKFSEKRRMKPGRFKCFCGDTFTEKHNLKNHLNSHRGVKPHSCEGCPSAFSAKSSLTRHHKLCKPRWLT